MKIDIDAATAHVVLDLAEIRLGNLSSAIRHTDTPRVREELRQERESLRALVLQLHALLDEPDAASA